MRDAVRAIWREQGLRGFYVGLGPFTMRVMAASSVRGHAAHNEPKERLSIVPRGTSVDYQSPQK